MQPRRSDKEGFPYGKARWRQKLHTVVFGVETTAGQLFDLLLLWTILFSILCVVLESVASMRLEHGQTLRYLEWTFTAVFTVEYIVRLAAVDRPGRYARSFFGIIDLLSIVPTYLSLVIGGAQTLLVIRAVRLLRVFRILKLMHFVGEADILLRALQASRYKITVFIGGVLSLILIMGSCMYLIEGPEHGFTNIPKSMYWAVVTLTTVGYGDIVPVTVAGKMMASVIMLLGYGIIAVPTGIVSVEIGRATHEARATLACPRCAEDEHLKDARYCHRCSEALVRPL